MGPVTAVVGMVALIWTLSPRLPLVSVTPLSLVRLVILGVTLKLVVLVALPAWLLAWILPLLAPLGTIALKLLAVWLVGVALVPLKSTLLMLARLVPVI